MKWNGKKKAITFSFDDNVTQDVRLVGILNRYGLKSTFNLNSDLIGTENYLIRNDTRVSHIKNTAEQIPLIYAGHEIAAHTLTHPSLPTLPDDEVIRQVEEDRLALDRLVGYEVVGMAYPGGGINNDERVADVIRKNTGIRYARTIESTYSFDLPTDLIRFRPTVYYIEDCLFDVAEKFLKTESDKPQLLYIWGHSYEMDAGFISWERFEDLCRMLSGKDDIFYGTNAQVLL